ncbi:protein phosphatase inhibitor 2 [Drosophila obscura]|uniref:protein phosphatase inhibitor 2 n=1 Tax=Drosophila obscura TaxID=7282 RepID=UPI000BA16638|nr:protein phosphatase inhibitor 2 [Drosophila obscura]
MDTMNSEDVKGILKGGSSGVQPQAGQKTAKFDELNVLQTFHPVGKTYGHMIIDEPKTPFVFEDDLPKELDTVELIEKLRLTSQSETPSFGMEQDSDDSSDDDDFPESVEEKVRRLEFERRRKLHYKEYLSVPLARRLIAEEFADMSTSEASYESETSSCILETCPQSDTDMLDEDTQLFDHSSPTQNQTDFEGEIIELEPGFDPSHPCYQRLSAETKAPRPDETQEALQIASLGYMRSMPSLLGREEYSATKPVRVPNTSIVVHHDPHQKDKKDATPSRE